MKSAYFIIFILYFYTSLDARVFACSIYDDVESSDDYFSKYFTNKNPDDLKTFKNKVLFNNKKKLQFFSTNDENDESHNNKPWTDWRLDSRITPLKYRIFLDIDLERKFFSGNVSIDVNATKPVEYIILHAYNNLLIRRTSVSDANSKEFEELRNGTPFLYDPNEYLVIPLKRLVKPKLLQVNIEFSSSLTTNLEGLYISRYVAGNGVRKRLAVTQFESIYARRAFPCFDEPQFKSVFKITISHSKELNAISNMPSNVTEFNGKKITVFEPSVPMTTYLVAMVVSDFTCTGGQTDGIEVQVCAVPEQQSNLGYALKSAQTIINYYAKTYFEIDFPLPKLDMVAIPDFRYGAMENWGLITYREQYLLFDENTSTTYNKMKVCLVIAHELGHQWFGNLVTMKWWDDIWLNEGFTTFIQYKSIDKAEPDWNFHDYFITEELRSVLFIDSTIKTHPIITPRQTNDETTAAFDDITYSKGASVIRMLESAIGEKNFQKGIQNYLRKYAYKNTVTQDLWQELSLAHPQKLNISEIMDTWTTKSGFPVVTISEPNDEQQTTISQERFLKDGSIDSKSNYLWTIPLTYYKTLGSNDVQVVWLRKSEDKVYVNISSSDNGLIKYNVGQTGVYIVNYPIEIWRKWTKALRDPEIRGKLTPSDRANLISDAFYLARSGRLSYNIPLELAKYLLDEDHLIPWIVFSGSFSEINTLLYQDLGSFIKSYIKLVVKKQYHRLGWNDEGDDNTRIFRQIIIGIACGYGYEPCLNDAKDNFDQLKRGTKIHPNLFSYVIRYGILQSKDTNDWDFLFKRYSQVGTTAEKLQYLQGLAATRDTKQLEKLLNLAFNETFIRHQDFFTLLSSVARNSLGLQLVWKFYQENFKKIVERFSLSTPSIGQLENILSIYFTKESQKREMLDFFKQNPDVGAGQIYREQAIETLDGNTKWLLKYGSVVGEWFKSEINPI